MNEYLEAILLAEKDRQSLAVYEFRVVVASIKTMFINPSKSLNSPVDLAHNGQETE